LAELGAIVGESGSGKSTSLRNLDPTKTFIINVAGKNLPIRNFKKNYTPVVQDPTTKKFTGNLYNSSNVDQIGKMIKIVSVAMPAITQIIIDDSQYLMAKKD
jgi:ABC-type phosphate/phosphonate transport system ATPase subunit